MQEDAFRVTRLKPDFKKGWFLLAKALWKDTTLRLGLGVKAMMQGRNWRSRAWKIIQLNGEFFANSPKDLKAPKSGEIQHFHKPFSV